MQVLQSHHEQIVLGCHNDVLCCRVPTPDWTRNISWYQFYKYNLSYLHITEFGYMDLNYRQNHFAFWRDYFPTVSARPPSKHLSPDLYKIEYMECAQNLLFYHYSVY